jgi:hypothetical protein
MSAEPREMDEVIASGEWLSETVAVEPEGTLYVHLDRGSVEIRSHASDAVRIEATCRGWASGMAHFTLERDGNDLQLDGDVDGWLAGLFGGARPSVRAWLPQRYSVEIHTRGGAVKAHEIGGRVAAQTSGGRIELRRIDGPALLRTSGGSIDAEEVNGDVRALTSGGKIEISYVNGDVEARTSGGSIHVHGVAGAVEARTSGGRIEVCFVDEPGGRLETSGGSIEVVIPEGAGADLNARTSGGRVEVDVDMECETHGRHCVIGRLCGGGLPLTLRTSGGNIRVRAA